MSKWATVLVIPISCAEPRLSKAGASLFFKTLRFMQSFNMGSSCLYHDDC